MYSIIERYINRLSLDDINNFALKNNITLTSDELTFTYDFIKKNSINILKNPNLFNIDSYKNKYGEENFIKIKKLFLEYFQKYANYL